MTGRGLLNAMEKFPDSAHILEDMEQILRDRGAQGVLRSALWGQRKGGGEGPMERPVTWSTWRHEHHFIFGGIIMIANRPLDDLPELMALRTRIACVQLLATDGEMTALMRGVAARGFRHQGREMTPAECREVCEFVVDQPRSLHRPLDMRILVNALMEIENGSYVRPSEARRRILQRGKVARLDLRQLVGDFLAEKRKVRGRKTAEAYQSRLMPVLDFAELSKHPRRGPMAMDIDRSLVIELRSSRVNSLTTRNGRAGGTPKPFSIRQVQNIPECLRSALAWARRADVRKLPVEWSNPLTSDLIGSPPARDPLREDMLPLRVRARIIGVMDRWQLCHLALSMVLPLRPDEATGLLIGNIDFENGWLKIGTRFGGGDFTKGGTSFKQPFPEELGPILRACVGDRAEGPLLRSRRFFESRRRARPIADAAELARLFERKLLQAPPGSVQAEQDRKQIFRRLLRELGGTSPDRMAAEFKGLLAAIGSADAAMLYTLRSSGTMALKDADLPHLEMRYLTGHSTDDILNQYATLDPVRAMRRYFDMIRPLWDAIRERAIALGLTGD